MIGRIIAALAFLAGGAVTSFAFAILKGYGDSQAGMSPGSVPAPPAMEALIPWFFGGYFVTSAIGMLLCRGRAAIRVAALVAHSLLLIAFLAICGACAAGPPEKFLTPLLSLTLITVMWFSPGFIIWLVFLLKAARPHQLCAPANGGSALPLDEAEAGGEPPAAS